ncbi:MAG TPA: 3,4-dihydroxy-2-butanone-4-phosphate synthase [Candidatus Aphodousia faecipullorum]|nr:3,4-dihydroxy-2-butanone-4-phosphate synthase [Candidatus Aphodousia faecipullorum]
MHQSENLLNRYGQNAIDRVERALNDLRAGKGVMVVDDEDRENEGDLIYSTDFLTVPQMALMIRACSGIVCVCLRDEDCERLQLPQMVAHNTNTQGTAFTVSIEAAHGCTTGVSAHDRVTTIKAAANPNGKPEDLLRPGHVYPLRARQGGVLERRGHTEATVDLMRLAGLNPAGVLCELMNEDGTMAKLPQVCDFADLHGLTVLSVEDIAEYRLANAC